jgi:predicted nucleic acid-binding protein
MDSSRSSAEALLTDRTGQTIGMADPIIAAVALDHGLELVTGNIAHYQRIQNLGYPLTLINWR